MYHIYESRSIYSGGNVRIEETCLFSGTKSECYRYEDERRKTYKDRGVVDCFTKSDEEIDQARKNREFYDSLSDVEKHDFIVVNGRKYIRSIYTRNNTRNKQ